MTMPVLALLTPAAAPQTQIGGQSALTDYSEGQQQSYSEDLAALLASMDAALVQLDTEVQQLSAGAESQTEHQDLVQSMLPQPLLFDPLLPAETAQPIVQLLAAVTAEPVVEELPVTEMQLGITGDVTTEQSGSSPLVMPQTAGTAAMQLFSAAATSGSAPNIASAAGQQQGALPVLAAVSVQQGITSDLAAEQAPMTQAGTAALASVLNQPAYTTQNISLNSSFTLDQNHIFATSQSKTAGLHQVMADILPPVAAVAAVSSAASSTLPVWQADPLPAQSQQWGQRLVQMLADKVDLQLGLNVKSAMIRLDPPSLGSIELSVQLDGDRLTVQMHSSNAQLREAMGQGLEQLRASLQQKLGADVQIDLRMGSDSSSQQQQQKNQQQFAQQTELNFHSEPELAATGSSQPNRLNLVNQLV
ncbi:MAG: flagellar hook-length control protein FliK [Gammaproteobacteria bacterium]|nr:flagellar hook-length control protein FliK [Gammaproteobacteria bacterium]